MCEILGDEVEQIDEDGCCEYEVPIDGEILSATPVFHAVKYDNLRLLCYLVNERGHSIFEIMYLSKVKNPNHRIFAMNPILSEPFRSHHYDIACGCLRGAGFMFKILDEKGKSIFHYERGLFQLAMSYPLIYYKEMVKVQGFDRDVAMGFQRNSLATMQWLCKERPVEVEQEMKNGREFLALKGAREIGALDIIEFLEARAQRSAVSGEK